MLQLKNNTPFSPMITVFPDSDGVDTLFVMVKATFRLGPPWGLATEQLPVTMKDEYWGEPESFSMKYASDIHLTKPGTDVILVGRAWAPNESKVFFLDVRLSVDGREKIARVTGNRRWKDGQPTQPESFQSMPLVYEYAYGGTHQLEIDGQPVLLAEEKNPVGRGFAGRRTSEEMEGLALPNVEEPNALIWHPGMTAPPLCFGPIAASWMPRRQYAGTYDDAWSAQRSPYLPLDFNSRFFQVAHPDLVFDQYLKGGELVELDQLSRRGNFRFALPERSVEAIAKVAGKQEAISMNLETVLFEPESDRMSMVWRGHLSCDKKILKVNEVTINLLDVCIDGKRL